MPWNKTTQLLSGWALTQPNQPISGISVIITSNPPPSIDWTQIHQSIKGQKTWVKVWISILILVNVSSLLFLNTPVGKWTTIAWIFVAMFNAPMIFYFSGLTRALAFPHLIWLILVPLIIYRLYFDQTSGAAGVSERIFGLVVLVTNGISLLFDILDSVKWFNGKREVLGLE